jgi:hypothetical protein
MTLILVQMHGLAVCLNVNGRPRLLGSGRRRGLHMLAADLAGDPMRSSALNRSTGGGRELPARPGPTDARELGETAPGL